MQRTERSYTVPAALERVVEVLLQADFHVELGDARADVERTELRWVDEGRVFELHQVEYGRTRTGAIDRSLHKGSVSRYSWDVGSHRLQWEWDGEEKRISISGGILLEPDGPGTRVTTWRQIEVRIPLVGGRLERIIDREFDASDRLYQDILRRYLGL